VKHDTDLLKDDWLLDVLPKSSQQVLSENTKSDTGSKGCLQGPDALSGQILAHVCNSVTGRVSEHFVLQEGRSLAAN